MLTIDPGFKEGQLTKNPEPVPSASPYQRYLFHLLRNFVCAAPDLRDGVEFRHLSFLTPAETAAEVSAHSGGMTTRFSTEWHYMAARLAAAQNPVLLALSAYLWSVRDLLIVAQYVRQIAPEIRIVIGGPEVYGEETALSLLASCTALDFAAFGEGELTLRELVRRVKSGGTDFSGVPFLAYRDGGGVRASGNRELLQNLDDIPSPVLSLSRGELAEHPLAVVSTSRGCPVGCSYCVYSVGLATGGKKVRSHSAARVLSELKYLRARGVKHIFFPDANFAADANISGPALRYLLDTYTDVRVYFEQKLELIPDRILDLIRRLQHQGRLSFDAGIQTVTPQALKDASRVQSLSAFVEKMRKLDLKKAPDWALCVDLMIGLPGDTYTGFLKSLDFVHNDLFGEICRPSNYYVASLAVLKGTEYHRRASELGIHYEPVPPYAVMRTNTMSFEELRQARILIEALAIITPAIKFLRSRGVALPALFERCFGGAHFSYAAELGWYDRPANLFYACAAFRRYLAGRPIDQDLARYAAELVDYCYLNHEEIDADTPAKWLKLPSLAYSPGKRGRGIAWPEKFWGSYHFKFRYGAQIFMAKGETMNKPAPRTAYLLMGTDFLKSLLEKPYLFLRGFRAGRVGAGALKAEMKKSVVFKGTRAGELAAAIGHLERRGFF